ALAGELRRAGRLDEAEAAMRECFHGVFRDDPYTSCEMGRVLAEKRDWPGLLKVIDSASKEQDRMIRMHLDMLRARALAGLGQTAEAEALYRQLSLNFIG